MSFCACRFLLRLLTESVNLMLTLCSLFLHVYFAVARHFFPLIYLRLYLCVCLRSCLYYFPVIYSDQSTLLNETTNLLYTVSQKKLCKLIFRHNFAKFRRIVKIFGTKMAERTGFSEVYSFSTSPNLCQHTTEWNADVHNCYITL